MFFIALGVRVVKGSHSDHKLITEEASKADIVLNAADADDLDLTKAVLAGLKQTTIGKIPILIHTSGTGLATKDPSGKWDPNYKIWNVRAMRLELAGTHPPQDNSVDDIRNIPADAPHRNVDLEYVIRIGFFSLLILNQDLRGRFGRLRLCIYYRTFHHLCYRQWTREQTLTTSSHLD